MTWTAARTWVDNELITAALLNQQIRDQFEAVGLHDHSAEPGAVVLTPDRVDLAQQTSAIVSTDPGRFQRTAAGLWYTVGAGQNAFVGPSAPAGTPATRALGAGDTDAAAGTHRHVVAGQLDTGAGVDLSGPHTGTIISRQVNAIAGEKTYAVIGFQVRRTPGTFGRVVLRDDNGDVLQTFDVTSGTGTTIGGVIVDVPVGGMTATLRFETPTGSDLTRTIGTDRPSFMRVSRVYVGAGLSP